MGSKQLFGVYSFNYSCALLVLMWKEIRVLRNVGKTATLFIKRIKHAQVMKFKTKSLLVSITGIKS